MAQAEVRVGQKRYKRFQYESNFEESVVTYSHVTHHRKQRADWRERVPTEKVGPSTTTAAAASARGALTRRRSTATTSERGMKYTTSTTGEMMKRALVLEKELEGDTRKKLTANYAATEGYINVLRTSRELMEEREKRLLQRMEQEEFERMVVDTNRFKRDLVEQQVSDAMDDEFSRMKASIQVDVKAAIKQWKELKVRESQRRRRDEPPPAPTSRSSSTASIDDDRDGLSTQQRQRAGPRNRLLPLPSRVRDAPTFEADRDWEASPTVQAKGRGGAKLPKAEGSIAGRKRLKKLNPIRHQVNCIKAYARPLPRTTHLMQMASVLPPLYSPPSQDRRGQQTVHVLGGPGAEEVDDADSALGDGCDPNAEYTPEPAAPVVFDEAAPGGRGRAASAGATPAVSCGELLREDVHVEHAAQDTGAGALSPDAAAARIQRLARRRAAHQRVAERRRALAAEEADDEEYERLLFWSASRLPGAVVDAAHEEAAATTAEE